MTEKPGAEIRRRLERTKPAKTHSWLAMRLGVNRSYISQVIRAERPISAKLAIKLAREFETTPKFWLDLQDEYDLDQAHREMAEAGG